MRSWCVICTPKRSLQRTWLNPANGGSRWSGFLLRSEKTSGSRFLKLQVGNWFVLKKSGQFVLGLMTSQLVQYWWYLSSLWRTTNSHRTSTWIHVETRLWFQCFFVFAPPHMGKWSSGVNLRPREIVVYLIAVRLVRLEKLIVKGEAQERRWRTPSGGNIGSLLVVCWPGWFGCNKTRKHWSVV